MLEIEFVDILNEVRLGKVSSKTSEILKSLSRKPNCFNKDIEPTQLYVVVFLSMLYFLCSMF
jgi:hypothetical protein